MLYESTDDENSVKSGLMLTVSILIFTIFYYYDLFVMYTIQYNYALYSVNIYENSHQRVTNLFIDLFAGRGKSDHPHPCLSCNGHIRLSRKNFVRQCASGSSVSTEQITGSLISIYMFLSLTV